MAEKVYNQMYELARNAKKRARCCDLNKKSFKEFWISIEDTLFAKYDSEDVRVEKWKELILKKYNIMVDYLSLKGDAKREPWVKRFSNIASGVPSWHNNGKSK